jgi:DNA primase
MDMYSIIDLLTEDGLDPKLVASTNGGEYASSCPGCGGEDRFRAWPSQGRGGRWWCRQCEKSGDLIQYLRDFRNLSFKASCAFLPINEIASDFHKIGTTPGVGQNWKSEELIPPLKVWQSKALSFVERAQQVLSTRQNKKIREWLINRGLREKTIKSNRLGWNPNDVFFDRGEWGLPEKIKENGKPVMLWVPAGLILPSFKAEEIHKISIRRSDPFDFDRLPQKGGRYVILSGSSAKTPLILGGEKDCLIIVESDLDAMLINQEAGDLISAISIGPVTNRPDKETTNLIVNSRLTLISLDRDEAGGKSALRWWIKQFPNARRWPSIKGKDPGEDYQAGVNLRDWIMAGLPKEIIKEKKK